MNLISTIPDNIIRALSNTFIYSLWQGLILAALAGLVVVLTRKVTPAKRYNLLVGLLASFAVTIAVTFILQYQQQPPVTADSESCLPAVAVNDQVTPLVVKDAPTEASSLLQYINTHAEMIVFAWFLIVCARCVQLLSGLHGLHRLRHEAASPGTEWEEKLHSLAISMGIRQHVLMAESMIAKVPMVIGHFKPIILIPAALLTAMQPAEIEAVLVHELAHIRRRDYLVNMLQHLMEIVFFFNPAVLWVSSLIKTERENCCDDITLGKTNDKTAYIRALINCQEFQSGTPSMAVGLAGRKNLLGRVNRMVLSRNHSLSIIEKSLLTVCLVTAGAMLAAFSDKKEEKKQLQLQVHALQQVFPTQKTGEFPAPAEGAFYNYNAPALEAFHIYKPAEIGEGTSCYIGDVADKIGYKTYILKRDDMLYQLNYIKGQLVSLQVNGNNISSADWAIYNNKVRQLNFEYDQNDNDLFEEKPDSAGKDPFDTAEKTISDGVNRSVKAIDEAGMAVQKSLRTIKAANDTLSPLRNKVEETITTQTTVRSTVNVDYNTVADSYYKEPYKPALPAGPVYKTGTQEEYKDRQKRKQWIKAEKLVTIMVEEGIVEKREDVQSFMINQDEIILNGRKLSAETHRMLLDKHIKAAASVKWTIYYNFDTSTIKSIGRSGINAS